MQDRWDVPAGFTGNVKTVQDASTEKRCSNKFNPFSRATRPAMSFHHVVTMNIEISSKTKILVLIFNCFLLVFSPFRMEAIYIFNATHNYDDGLGRENKIRGEFIQRRNKMFPFEPSVAVAKA